MTGWLPRLAAAVLLLAAPPIPADHPTRGTATLTGIPSVEVVVEPLGGYLQAHGLAADRVRRAAASALEAAGIPTGAAEHAGRLHVRLDTRRASRKFLALAIDLELRQHVRLERPPERVISATTWSNAAVTPLREGDCDAVPARVASLVEETFVRDFLAANPSSP